MFSAGISLGLEGSYQSQIGLAGWLVTLPATLFGFTGTVARFSIYTIVAIANAAVATIIVRQVWRSFTVAAAVVVGAMLIQPWMLIFAATPFLFFGIRFVPAMWLAYQLRRGNFSLRALVLMPLLLTVVVFASGYAWATVVVAISAATVAYFAVAQSWSFRKALRICACSLIGSIGGLVVTLILHTAQLAIRFGSLEMGWRQIAYALTKRTGSGGEEVTDPLLIEALAASPRLVLDWYLGMPVLLSPARVPVIGNVTVLALVAVCAFIVLHDLLVKPESPGLVQRQAIGVAWVISLLGPIGWILLFRPTVYIHTHIDGAVWYMPTIPLGALLIWLKFSGAERSVTTRTKVYIVMMLVVGAVIGALYFVSWSLVTPLP